MWDALDEELDEARGRERGPDAGERCTIKSRYIHNDDGDARHQLAVQVRYIAVEDPRDPPDREARQLFTEGDTDVTGKEARGMIWQNRSMKGAVCFHRLILSPSTGLGIKTRADTQEWTRAVMRDLSVQVDRDLTWVAGCHTNRSHTHVHILIAGEATLLSKGGTRRVVRFKRTDITELRERITIEAARPIRNAAQDRARTEARATQDAQRAALYERLGVPLIEVGAQPPTAPAASAEAQAIPLVRPSQAARKRHWWQRGA